MSATQVEQVSLPPKKDFIPSLGGGRAVAMFLVFGGHFLAMGFATPVATQLQAYSADAKLGASDMFFAMFFGAFIPVPMDYFFVLSGFVLAWAYRPNRSPGEFWLRRFGKVYPVYIVTTVVCFLLFGLMFAKWTSWKVIFASVFLLQAWTPDQRYNLGLNPVMWTLSAEAFNYLLFPALMLVLVRARRRGLVLTLVVCVAATFILPFLAERTFDMHQPAPPVIAPLEGYPNQFAMWFTVMFPLMRLLQFIIGIALAQLLRTGTRWAPNVPVALLIFFAGLAVTDMFLPIEMSANGGMIIPIALLIVALAKADLKGKWSPLRSRPMVFLGKISYSFYAVHILWVIFTVVQVPVPSGAWDFPRLWLYQAGIISDPKIALPWWANVALFFVYLFAAGFSAWLLYRFVETPLNRVIRNRASRMRKLDAPVEAPVSPADAPGLAVSPELALELTDAPAGAGHGVRATHSG
jgi:peptidoglycan/LPS O-acetylase OafA/YrhL